MWAANPCLSPNIGGSGYCATYDYAACFDADVTGGTCAAVCKAGYTTGSGSTSISLVCGTDGAFDTPTLGDPLVCTANSCTDAVPISATTGLDYSSCVDGDVTGAMCVPICLAGYTASGSTSGFALTSAGAWTARTAAGLTAAGLTCSPNTCGSAEATHGRGWLRTTMLPALTATAVVLTLTFCHK